MKKLLILTIAIIGLSITSCNEPTVQKTDLPIEVVTLKETAKFDTIYSIETEKKTYLFNNKHEYLGAYKKQNEEGESFIFGIWVALLIIGFIAAIIL